MTSSSSSSTAAGPTTSPARPPRVAYFVASHVNPDQVLRLARACLTGNGHGRVLIHHNYAVSDLPREAALSIPNVDLLDHDPRAPIEWGGFGQCAMILRALRWLLANRAFDWVVHLSGQDYPVRPLAEVEAFLGATPFDGFVDTRAADETAWVIGPQRYYYRYYQLPQVQGVDAGAAADPPAGRRRPGGRPAAPGARPAGAGPRVPPRRPAAARRAVPDGFRCYTGSAWWTLSRRAADRLVRRADADPGLARHYRRAQFAATESYFPTLLRNDPDLRLVTDDDKRFVRWSDPETGHPDLLGEADFPTLAASGDHFARKVDQRTAGRLLDLLDQHIARG
jgi:hypothetical protein